LAHQRGKRIQQKGRKKNEEGRRKRGENEKKSFMPKIGVGNICKEGVRDHEREEGEGTNT